MSERLVFGLGRSGLGVLAYLRRKGLPADFHDDRPKAEEVAQAQAWGFAPAAQLSGYREVIAAPGVPIDHPALGRLRAEGAEILGEAELAYRLSPTPLIGITGTAGKGTATVATEHFLKALGFRALAGGNLDPPLLDIVDQAEVAVVELSSFQLERIVHFRPRVAVLLNLGVDHLDRHKTLAAYHAAKLNLLRNLTPEDALVYNAADERIIEGIQGCVARRIPFWPQPTPRQTNLLAARLAARAYAELAGKAVDEGVLEQAQATAPQLEGRFEAFARKGEVTFIDDSIATRFDAVRAALLAAPRPIAWILGGVDKGAPVAELREVVRERVRVILAVGRDGPRMAQWFSDLAEVVPIHEAEGQAALRKAVQEGLKRLQSGSILLAPLGTSFDQFKDYKHRSKVFRQVALELGAVPLGGE
ncbi:UDP-N-acetylmuramoyl-L-alanine--D-glutamate ligase [Calidithermus roseus]|uniref:UDP-N-acetylmuramoylalanine--D-glutamate ligase n=1 Tax=Calidithermus roseus TaxID=1644118 RepID=A0A399EKC3_9DEIN|nr:UDP-N-acetylmuramoyl-L-alanine--D-glutamate ligase [Calidithermus roseus]RIH82832.1 UDP-N-acetylmuramoylalanine--D-glutamate ligase [Calidithermus roseus]